MRQPPHVVFMGYHMTVVDAFHVNIHFEILNIELNISFFNYSYMTTQLLLRVVHLRCVHFASFLVLWHNPFIQCQQC